MFEAIIKVVERWKAVKEAAHKAAADNLNHGVASIRKDVQSTIQKAPKDDRSGGKKGVRRARHAASPPGTPPYTQRGQLPRSIVFDKATPTNLSAVVGPRASVVGQSAAAHEFGGEYRGEQYPARPFMEPALERGVDKFAGSFQGSIGG